MNCERLISSGPNRSTSCECYATFEVKHLLPNRTHCYYTCAMHLAPMIKKLIKRGDHEVHVSVIRS